MRLNPYRLLSFYNDYKAVRKGPQAIAKRAVRKAAYRSLSSILRRSGL